MNNLHIRLDQWPKLEQIKVRLGLLTDHDQLLTHSAQTVNFHAYLHMMGDKLNTSRFVTFSLMIFLFHFLNSSISVFFLAKTKLTLPSWHTYLSNNTAIFQSTFTIKVPEEYNFVLVVNVNWRILETLAQTHSNIARAHTDTHRERERDLKILVSSSIRNGLMFKSILQAWGGPTAEI